MRLFTFKVLPMSVVRDSAELNNAERRKCEDLAVSFTISSQAFCTININAHIGGSTLGTRVCRAMITSQCCSASTLSPSVSLSSHLFIGPDPPPPPSLCFSGFTTLHTCPDGAMNVYLFSVSPSPFFSSSFSTFASQPVLLFSLSLHALLQAFAFFLPVFSMKGLGEGRA